MRRIIILDVTLTAFARSLRGSTVMVLATIFNCVWMVAMSNIFAHASSLVSGILEGYYVKIRKSTLNKITLISTLIHGILSIFTYLYMTVDFNKAILIYPAIMFIEGVTTEPAFAVFRQYVIDKITDSDVDKRVVFLSQLKRIFSAIALAGLGVNAIIFVYRNEIDGSKLVLQLFSLIKVIDMFVSYLSYRNFKEINKED